MERLKQKYRELTGREPGQIILLGETDSKKVLDGLTGPRADSANELEIIDIDKVGSVYKVKRITDIHRKSRGYKGHKGHYSGTSILLGDSCPVELDDAWNGLKDGDKLTVICYGDTLKEIAEKREKLFKQIQNEERTRKDFFDILNGLCVTDGFLLKRPCEILSDDNSAAASFVVLNEYGFHARPAATFSKLASKYDCDIYVKNFVKKKDSDNRDYVVSAKSIMGVMTLQAVRDSKLVCAAAGFDSHDCIQDLVNLVRSEKFVNESG